MKKVREGMYDIGTVKDGDYKSIIIVNLNNGTVIFNNSNRGNGGTWTDIVPIVEIMKEGCNPNNRYRNEKWYTMYKKFVQTVSPDEYNIMLKKINNGII